MDQGCETSKTATKCRICEKIIHVLRSPTAPPGLVYLGSGIQAVQPDSCNRHQKLLISALGLESSPLINGVPALAKHIAAVKVMKTPRTWSTLVIVRMTRESPIPTPQWSSLFAIRQPGNPEDLVTGRILDVQWIDPHLPGLWKSTCNRRHGDSCQTGPSEYKYLSTLRPAWLIDVQEKCLVPAPQKGSYVALSYVWGGQNTLEATRGNVDRLRQKGALSVCEASIPRTIRDAMGVTKLLDERYLWVDALCIIQDDDSQKHTEMAKMSGIYFNASVTIIAVQGEHANSGLRGFRGLSEPRNLRQSIHCLDGGVTVVQYPVKKRDSELGNDSPVWDSRGWTYQEDLFSRRRLIFDGDSVRWECAASVMREHVESSRDIEPHDQGVAGHQSMFTRSIPELGGLEGILEAYNTRALTFPEDALNAFAGVAFAFSPAFAGRFVSGLPTAFFDIALLWQPQDNKIVRRVARKQDKHHCLPSWSWAGWSGLIDVESDAALDFVKNRPSNDTSAWSKMEHSRVQRILTWKYHETLTSPGVSIDASILASKDAWLRGRGQIKPLDGWSQHPMSESPEHGALNEPPDPRSSPQFFYKHEAHPGYEFWYPIPLLRQEDSSPSILAPYISCTTRRARLLREKPPVIITGNLEFHLLTNEQTWAGTLRLQDQLEASLTQEASREAIELVEVAKGLTREPWLRRDDKTLYVDERAAPQWHELYYVLWVEWTKGIAYRKGLGRVRADVWEKQRGEPFVLMLG